VGLVLEIRADRRADVQRRARSSQRPSLSGNVRPGRSCSQDAAGCPACNSGPETADISRPRSRNSGSAPRLVPGLRRATGGHRPSISSRSPTWQRPGRDTRWPARRGCGPRPLRCSGRGHQGQQENAPAAAWSRVRSHLPGVPCPESAVVLCGAIIQSGHSRSFPDQSGTCFLATGCSRAACELILLLNVHGAASSAVHGQVLQGSYTALHLCMSAPGRDRFCCRVAPRSPCSLAFTHSNVLYSSHLICAARI
jgi:hypothetical protein